MNMTGMIFQFNSDDGKGLIMLTDGQTKEFTVSQWADENNMPSVGLKISYDEDAQGAKVKKYDESKEQPVSPSTSIEEYIEHFKGEGYNLVKDLQEGNTRTVTFRKFSVTEHSEVVIKSVNNEISITRTINGKESVKLV